MTRLVDIIEIDVPLCQHDYGASPCTAAIGVTGAFKCYRTLGTCQDEDNYLAGTALTWRFARAADYLRESGIEAIPSLVDVSYRPSTIKPGEGLGERATLTVTFRDHHWADTGENLDPYLEERSFDPYRQGTFWGKWRARQPYMEGQLLRWKQGRVGDALGDFITRHFVVERFEGPGLDGRYTITARDALQLLFDDRAQCPPASSGRLLSAITNTATSATLSPAGIGDEEYPAFGYLNLGGKEAVYCTRSGDTLTLTGGRAQLGTTAVAHDAGTRVQVIAAFISESPDEALARLETDYSDTPADYIPTTEWADEISAFYGGGLLTAFIAEPTPTRQLAEEIILECGLSTWWDELDGKQRLQVIREVPTDALLFNARNIPGESNVIAGSFTVEEQPDKRISRSLCWFGQENPLGPLDRTNLPLFVIQIATKAERAEGKKLDEIFSRWIASGGTAAAEAVTSRRLARFVKAPRRFTLRIPRWGNMQPRLGQGCRLMADTLQDETGAAIQVPCQIVRVNPNAAQGAEYELTLEELRIDPEFAPQPLNNTVIFAGNEQNVNALGALLALYQMPAAKAEVTFIVNEGVVIGSDSTADPALYFGDVIIGGDTYSWPTQVSAGVGRTNGSAVLTGLGSTTNLVAGQGVKGTGIPRGAKILSVDSGSQITLDRNATSTGSGSITIGLVIIRLIVRGKISGAGGRGGRGRSGDNNPGENGQPGGTGLETTVPINLEGEGDGQGGGGGGGGGAGDYVGWFGPQVNGAGGGGGAGALPGAGGAGGGPAGNPGTLTDGGAAKSSTPQSQGWGSGAGGDPGQAGTSGYGYAPGSGGAAGNAVNGWSWVNDDDWSGTLAGPTIN